MIEVKNNFRGMYGNSSCRACKKEIETNEHAFEKCRVIHPNNPLKIQKQDYFNDGIEKMKETLKKIEKITTILDKT